MSKSRNAPVQLSAHVEKLPLIEPFHITGYTFTEADMLVVSLRDGDRIGCGEGLGVYYFNDTPHKMLQQIEALRSTIEAGISHDQLLELLPAGGARNAIDCALWDLEAKRYSQPVWQLAGTPAPQPLLTTFTVSADDPDAVARSACTYADAKAIKLKLTNDSLNAARVRAARKARPDVWLMVDANQGFTRDSFAALLPTLLEARVAVVEQPFPIGCEEWLDGLDCPIPLAADESVQNHHDLHNLLGRVKIINIKLDKCGGLTEALTLAQKARALGFDLMIGNMGGSSWSIAPAFVVGSLCSVVDLDGPVFLSSDRAPAANYHAGHVWCPDEVWGGPTNSAA